MAENIGLSPWNPWPIVNQGVNGYTRAMRSQLNPMKKVAKMLRRHRDLILNWFRAQGLISSGTVEGLNGNAKLTTRKARGFRTQEGVTIALFHTLGHLPEPEFTHRFC